MNKKIILFVLCILFISSVTAISNKDRILQLLGNYEEECLEYQYIKVVQREFYNPCDEYNYNTVDINNYSMYIGECKNMSRIITVQQKTNKCVKWHLVRYEKKIEELKL